MLDTITYQKNPNTGTLEKVITHTEEVTDVDNEIRVMTAQLGNIMLGTDGDSTVINAAIDSYKNSITQLQTLNSQVTTPPTLN
jgi:hypothetical protein